MTTQRTTWFGILSVLVVALALGWGCSKRPAEATQQPHSEETAGDAKSCDFKGGPTDALVKVVAYYPGRHEDTLALVKGLPEKFPGEVSVEIVDWRFPDGLTRRNNDGFSCGTIAINGKNAFDLEENGKKWQVLFVRGVDGEWTEDDLMAAVRQSIAVAKQK
jgi:hypothetical protein